MYVYIHLELTSAVCTIILYMYNWLCDMWDRASGKYMFMQLIAEGTSILKLSQQNVSNTIVAVIVLA